MFHVKQSYEVVVVGGGHAGCEAALVASRMGAATLLITMDAGKIAEMSCNPSIGGVGKGQLVRELDALGGEMGKNADYTGIQFKRLNTRKGSAVQSSRCQSDKKKYALRMQDVIRGQANLSVLEGEVKAIECVEQRVSGLSVMDRVGQQRSICARTAVITAGTFMQGLMHCGELKSEGGRFGEKGSNGLSQMLAEFGFVILRLKTGTPPRLLRDSIDFSKMDEQPGDEKPHRFSFSETEISLPQVSCFLTYTTAETHGTIQKNLHRSPLYSGHIKGIGPRYCPSIEDKVVKFPDKQRHPLFFEPEALDSDWIYPNGISTSLPPDVQDAFVRTIPGCENVRFARYGYAVEYDCIDPRQLSRTLESKSVSGLFFAGQVNGTSGYEEAAAQGIFAGINAALASTGKPPFELSRTESYIGVMVDDLVSLGVTEPYRMFTSRAEYRLSLREDNADIRLRPYAIGFGLLSDEERTRFQDRKRAKAFWKERLERTFVKPSEEVQSKLANWGAAPLSGAQSLTQLIRRPELGFPEILQLAAFSSPPLPDDDTLETLEIELKYEGYIQLQRDEIDRLEKMRELQIPALIDYAAVIGLSTETREKLRLKRPRSLADASTISGVTPAALTALLFHIRKKEARPC